MDYKLAEELKDAGFPSPEEPGKKYNSWTLKETHGFAYIVDKEFEIQLDPGNIFHRDFIYIPTLSELIEECGEEFKGYKFVLWKYGKYWEAGYRKYDYDDIFLDPHGKDKIRDIAVAKLYIVLNKK